MEALSREGRGDGGSLELLHSFTANGHLGAAELMLMQMQMLMLIVIVILQAATRPCTPSASRLNGMGVLEAGSVPVRCTGQIPARGAPREVCKDEFEGEPVPSPDRCPTPNTQVPASVREYQLK
ncbi:hypothetical protein P7K49_032136 [Saguinus oedipus]|uniref:Uncharacterized protein n=1 Tax=Saguinus oedipus TaxID=9490 RepID=A0ABQ9TYB7_SAGOE|nr:hypothetical protein P7K49_032136 [Saguinus oedipus]